MKMKIYMGKEKVEKGKEVKEYRFFEREIISN
jgi:hypothetical protein